MKLFNYWRWIVLIVILIVGFKNKRQLLPASIFFTPLHRPKYPNKGASLQMAADFVERNMSLVLGDDVSEIPLIVPHFVVPARAANAHYWNNAGRDVHLFQIDPEQNTITHAKSGARWPRSVIDTTQLRWQLVDNTERKQAQQYTDFYDILGFLHRERCFGHRYFMLSDDDVRPCSCVAKHVQETLKWLQTIDNWKIMRFSVGSNGLLMKCDSLPSIRKFLAARWMEHRFSHAIDAELLRWASKLRAPSALEWHGVPQPRSIVHTDEYTFRFVLFRHETESHSTMWHGEAKTERSLPSCYDTLVWVPLDRDEETFYHRSSFDVVRCSSHLVSPCSALNTPRYDANQLSNHCKPHTPSLPSSLIHSELHVLLAPRGMSCSERCATSQLTCDDSAQYVINDVEILAPDRRLRPQRCLATLEHRASGHFPAIKPTLHYLFPLCLFQNNRCSYDLNYCYFEPITEPILINNTISKYFECDAIAPESESIIYRMCPCAKATTSNDEIENIINSNGCDLGWHYGSNNRCVPCPLGTFGGGGNNSCSRCPSAPHRRYHSRLGAKTIDQCSVACVDGSARNCRGLNMIVWPEYILSYIVIALVIVWQLRVYRVQLRRRIARYTR